MSRKVQERHITTEVGLLKQANDLGVFGFGKLVRELLSFLDRRYVRKQFDEDGEEINVFDRVETHVKLHEEDRISTTLKKHGVDIEKLYEILKPYSVKKTIQNDTRPRRVVADVTEVRIDGKWVRKAQMPDYNYNTQMVADVLGLSMNQVQVLCRTGAIQARKVGQPWAVTKHGLFDYIVKNKPEMTRHVTEDRIIAPEKAPADVIVEYLLDEEETEKKNE